MAEWLGRGLQNLVQRFESASDLQDFDKRLNFSVVFLFGGGVSVQAHTPPPP